MNIKNNFLKALNKPVINIGYCAAWYLLKDIEKVGSNVGVNGWNYDCYVFDKVIICTGYRTSRTGGKFDISITDKHNKDAQTIWEDYNFSYTERQHEVEAIRQKWLDELYNTYGELKK